LENITVLYKNYGWMTPGFADTSVWQQWSSTACWIWWPTRFQGHQRTSDNRLHQRKDWPLLCGECFSNGKRSFGRGSSPDPAEGADTVPLDQCCL